MTIIILSLIIILLLTYIYSGRDERDKIILERYEHHKLIVKYCNATKENLELKTVIEKLNFDLNDEIENGKLLKLANESIKYDSITTPIGSN